MKKCFTLFACIFAINLFGMAGSSGGENKFAGRKARFGVDGNDTRLDPC